MRWPTVEAVGDLSDSIGLNWVSTTEEPRVRYRPLGTAAWLEATATTGSFPGRSERVHRARLTGLQPDTVYEARPWGAPMSDIIRFRTTPAGLYEPKLIHLADYQQNLTGPGNAFDAMNAVVQSHLDEVHLVIAGGDYVSDDGVRSALNGQRWVNFLTSVSPRFVRSDGTHVPFVWLAGNHEVVTNYANVADPANPVGEPGYLAHLFQFLWDPMLPNTPVRGHGWLKLGANLLLVFLDTNHTTLLSDQLASFAAILAEHAPAVRHVCFVSHVGPWRGQWAGADGWAAHRQLRREFLPITQQYPNVKFWLTGHEHNFCVTHPLLAVPETGNEYKWVRDEAAGIVFTGHGGWATVSTRDLANRTLLSTVDGSLMYESWIVSRSPDLAFEMHNIDHPPAPPSGPANVHPEAWHWWALTFGTTSVRAVAHNAGGHVYKTITRPLDERFPSLKFVRREGGQCDIEFTGILQFSPDLVTPFVDVPGATSPYTVPIEGLPRAFFQVRTP